MRTLAALIALVALTGTAACRRHRDPNTAEGRAAAEEREEDERRADEKRSRKEARRQEKEREREERRRGRDASPVAAPLVAPVGGAGVAVGVPDGGTCDASCSHYLSCKGTGGGAQRDCVAACLRMNLTRDALLGFERTDCATAIAVVEKRGGAQAPTGSSSECNGCVWDGSSCIWLSQSNWGAGPYSGAASSCKAACCQRR